MKNVKKYFFLQVWRKKWNSMFISENLRNFDQPYYQGRIQEFIQGYNMARTPLKLPSIHLSQRLVH